MSCEGHSALQLIRPTTTTDIILAGGGDARLQRSLDSKHRIHSNYDFCGKLDEIVENSSEKQQQQQQLHSSLTEDTTSSGEDFPGRVPPEGASNHRTLAGGGGVRGGEFCNVSDPHPIRKEFSYEDELDDRSFDPAKFSQQSQQQLQQQQLHHPQFSSPSPSESWFQKHSEGKGAFVYPLPDNLDNNSSLVSSSVADTPDKDEDGYSPFPNNHFHQQFPLHQQLQQQQHHQYQQNQQPSHYQHQQLHSGPEISCSRSSAAYTPTSLESAEIICTSSTSHTYNHNDPFSARFVNEDPFSSKAIDQNPFSSARAANDNEFVSNNFVPATPCNCNSCQMASSRPADQVFDGNDFHSIHHSAEDEDRHLITHNAAAASAANGNFPTTTTQCGCESCVNGISYEDGGKGGFIYEGDSAEVMARPLSYPVLPTAPLIVNNNNNNFSSLPRSRSEIPDYFEGDPSVMVNSKSDHSIKIHMTGDTMQVEIVSPVVEAGGGEEEVIDVDCREELNLSTDFDLVFKEMEDANGELTRIPEACVRNWGAEIFLAIDDLHALGIVWKDFNPRNILMDEKGHVVLSFVATQLLHGVDYVNEDTVTSLYTAPEVAVAGSSSLSGLDRSTTPTPTAASDWWSVGAVLFEMLVGASLRDCFSHGFHAHSEVVDFPDHVSAEARSLLRDLLRYHPQCRLGAGQAGFEEIKSHPFFEGILWPEMTEE